MKSFAYTLTVLFAVTSLKGTLLSSAPEANFLELVNLKSEKPEKIISCSNCKIMACGCHNKVKKSQKDTRLLN